MVETTMPDMVMECAARLLIFMHSRPAISAPASGASGIIRYNVCIVIFFIASRPISSRLNSANR